VPDVRILTATNRALTSLIRTGDFRPDLFYRLNVLVLNIPPLRDRRDDIPLLVEMMTRRLQERLNKKRTLTPAAVGALAQHHYPGNVRELWNVLERSFVTATGSVIDVADILLDPVDGPANSGARPKSTLSRLDSTMLREAIGRHTTQRAVAKALGVSQATVSRRARLYGLF
jgi:transcriptional regulator with PAS, ATPase and Fis domain